MSAHIHAGVSDWISCGEHPHWNVLTAYRRKAPQPMKVTVKCWYRPSHESVIWSAADQTVNGCVHQPQHDITVEVPA